MKQQKKIFMNYKYILLSIFIAISFTKAFAQQSAEVSYKAYLDLEYRFDEFDETTELSKKVKKSLVKKNEILKELTFKLRFNSNESYYSWNKQMKDETVSDFDFLMAIMTGGDGIYYRNNQKKILLNVSKNESEQLINMSIPYNKIKWKITNETDTYLGYQIIKAVSGKYHVAWFAPSIPVPFGPSEYGNLPGLILKYNYRSRWIVATKIKFFNNPIYIEMPSQGIHKTEEEVLSGYRNN